MVAENKGESLPVEGFPRKVVASANVDTDTLYDVYRNSPEIFFPPAGSMQERVVWYTGYAPLAQPILQ